MSKASNDTADETAVETGHHQRNGHTLHLDGCMWRCLQCRHWFDAASDANAFWCGDPCAHEAGR